MGKSEVEDLIYKIPSSVGEAFGIQREISNRVISQNCFSSISTVAGADVAVIKETQELVCGIVVFSFPELEVIERVWSVEQEKFPYIPTLLAFREGPVLLKTYKKLKNKPDLLIVDGQGLAHPRRFGIACHVGVLLDIPAFGIAKKRLFGTHKEPGEKRGSMEHLFDPRNGEVIGAVLRTRDSVKPVFVSIGNKIDLGTAVDITLRCHSGYRIPFPTRCADRYVAEVKRRLGKVDAS